MELLVPEKGIIQEQIEEALLSGMPIQEIIDAGFNPSSVAFCATRMHTAGRYMRPPSFIGLIQRAQRKWIFERDKYTCQKCGASGFGVVLEIHHKDHNGKNNRASNRITWCKQCNHEDGMIWAKLSESERAWQNVVAARTKHISREEVRKARMEEHAARVREHEVQMEVKRVVEAEERAARKREREAQVKAERTQRETTKVLSGMSSFMKNLMKGFK